MTIVDVFTSEFMIRALLAGLLVASITGVLGVFVILKNKSYLSDGIAHASLAGIALGLLLSFQPVMFAIIVAIVMAVALTFLQRRSTVKVDSLIGIFYPIFFAIGIILINLSTSYQPEITSYLFGSILLTSWTEIIIALLLFVLVVSIVVLLYEKLVYATFDPEAAFVRGVKVELLEYLINILTAITIVVAVRIVGIIMVAGLLIIPANTAKLIARKFVHMIPLSVVISLFDVLVGILIAYFVDVPPGAAIVLVSGGLFVFTLIFNSFYGKK